MMVGVSVWDGEPFQRGDLYLLTIVQTRTCWVHSTCIHRFTHQDCATPGKTSDATSKRGIKKLPKSKSFIKSALMGLRVMNIRAYNQVVYSPNFDCRKNGSCTKAAWCVPLILGNPSGLGSTWRPEAPSLMNLRKMQKGSKFGDKKMLVFERERDGAGFKTCFFWFSKHKMGRILKMLIPSKKWSPNSCVSALGRWISPWGTSIVQSKDVLQAQSSNSSNSDHMTSEGYRRPIICDHF